jgi:hypothetical protein
MYSSLDRVDVITEDKATGRKSYLQIDHRSVREIRREEEVSVLFGLTRIMNARQLGEREGVDRVLYACPELPPDFLQRAVASAGGWFQLEDLREVHYEGPLSKPEDLADEAFRRLARKVLKERNAALEESALAALEQEHLGAPGPEDDEHGHWTRVVELAAVAGELLRAKSGGRWIEAWGMATLPFVFHLSGGGGADPRINAVGRAERFLKNGGRDSLVHLLRMAEDHANQQALPRRVLVTLKPPRWPARDKTVGRPVLEGDAAAIAVPWAVYGEDMPNSFAIFKKDGAREHQLETLHAQALENLKTLDVELQEVDAGAFKMIVASGHYFAAEKVLDAEFMRGIHARLQTPLLLVGVPRKGLLFIMDARVSPEAATAFVSLCRTECEKDDSEPICSTPLLLRDGKICGFAQIEEEQDEPAVPAPEASPPPQGFFGRLMGRFKN